MNPFLSWYLASTAAGLVGLPLAFRFFRRLPDRGYAFARPLGLLLAGYVFWLLGTFGFARNDVGGIVAAGLIVAGLGLAWLGRGGLAELRAWLSAEGRYVLAVEVLFLAAFGLLAGVRAYTPDIFSTEKPMEFMFINSVLRSPVFPPQDAWLAGHAISYYYFGYVLIAALARLTGVASEVAFNLGLALWFALSAVAAFGVLLNLMALASARPAAEPEPLTDEDAGSAAAIASLTDEGGLAAAALLTDQGGGPARSLAAPAPARRPVPSALAGLFLPALLGPLFVLVVGNFYGPLALAHANGMLAEAKVWTVRYDFGPAEAPDPGVRAGWVGVWDWLDLKGLSAPPEAAGPTFNWDPGYWWWFYGARVVHDRDLLGRETEAIDEMPAFSFVLGDMHPHVLALPFVLLASGLALTWLLEARAGLFPDAPGGARAALAVLWRPEVRAPFGLSAVLLGALGFLNTWDLPIYGFLIGLALLVGLGLRRGWDGLLASWRQWSVWGAVLLALSIGLYLPFYLGFQSQAGGLLPNLIFPTRFQQTLVMFGPPLIGVTLFLGWLSWRARADLDWRTAGWVGGGLLAGLLLAVLALTAGASFNPELLARLDGVLAPLTRSQAIGLLLRRRAVDSLAILFPLAVIGLAAGLLVGALRRATQLELPSLASPASLLVLAMIVTGALLLFGPELVYLRDNFSTRMNTLFKFYFQVWNLWALAAAFGLWQLGRQAGRWGRIAAWAGLSLALAGGLLYTVPAVLSRTANFTGRPTLDGMAYFAHDYPDDWAAILWLRANVAGAPVIAEGIGGQYWIEGRFSRFSMATGLPAVMGWPGHEAQWRGEGFGQVAEREDQIRTLYQVRDWPTAQAILERYDIEYVIVSSLEKSKYGAVYEAKFQQNMRLAFQSGDVSIYQRLVVHP